MNNEDNESELRKKSEELMLTFPVVSSHNSVKKFQQVNIFGYEEGSRKEDIVQGVYPQRLTLMRSSRVVDLLLISDDERQHYCVIKSKSRVDYSPCKHLSTKAKNGFVTTVSMVLGKRTH